MLWYSIHTILPFPLFYSHDSAALWAAQGCVRHQTWAWQED